MKIGFIGAGKVGFSLGRYFTEHDVHVSGFYSQNPESAREAAEFTGTRYFNSLECVVGESDIIFLTVPDTQIRVVWEQLKNQHIYGKIVCHNSGALSTDIFSDIDRYKAYGYSIHPLFAISDKHHSYKELSKCLFTIEGPDRYLTYFMELFQNMGNTIQKIEKEDKVRYHAAAAMASNLMVALSEVSETLLMECGFTREKAHQALGPIMLGNVQHIVDVGNEAALTGPLERGDIRTVESHMGELSGNDREIYTSLSRELLNVAKRKNKNRDYSEMEDLLR